MACEEHEFITFRARLHALPRELFDQIYDESFTASSAIVNINQAYRPSSRLQVDRASRAKFAPSFYSMTTFIGHTQDCIAWLHSLQTSHLRVLSDIRCFQAYDATGIRRLSFAKCEGGLADVEERLLRMSCGRLTLGGLNWESLRCYYWENQAYGGIFAQDQGGWRARSLRFYAAYR